MSANEYNFVTVWKIAAPLQEVWDIVYDVENLPSWWKAVISVDIVDEGDANGINSIVKQVWKGALPYQLSFDSKTTKIDYLKTIEIVAAGDLNGRGKWTFSEDMGITTVQYNWDVQTKHKVLSLLAFVIKPILAWNHDEIMRWGALGLAEKLNAKLIEY